MTGFDGFVERWATPDEPETVESGCWIATTESWGFSIGSDGVKEYRNGEEIPVDPLRACELIGNFRFALGDSIADLVDIPRFGEDQ